MSKRFARALLTAPVAVLLPALGATAALAAATFTVTPGGHFTGQGKLSLNQGGTSITCESSIAGKFRGGTGPGGHVGSITSLGLSNCTGPLGLAFTARAGALPWTMNAQSYKSGTTTGKIAGIHLNLSGPSCSFAVDGTGGNRDNGKVTFTYTNGTRKLLFKNPGNLRTYDVSGCAGLIASGDAITLSASYTISPPQQITSP